MKRFVSYIAGTALLLVILSPSSFARNIWEKYGIKEDAGLFSDEEIDFCTHKVLVTDRHGVTKDIGYGKYDGSIFCEKDKKETKMKSIKLKDLCQGNLEVIRVKGNKNITKNLKRQYCL